MIKGKGKEVPEVEPDTLTQSGPNLNKHPVLSLLQGKTHGQGEARIMLSFLSRLGCSKIVSTEDWRWLGRRVGKGIKASDRLLDSLTCKTPSGSGIL